MATTKNNLVWKPTGRRNHVWLSASIPLIEKKSTEESNPSPGGYVPPVYVAPASMLPTQGTTCAATEMKVVPSAPPEPVITEGVVPEAPALEKREIPPAWNPAWNGYPESQLADVPVAGKTISDGWYGGRHAVWRVDVRSRRLAVKWPKVPLVEKKESGENQRRGEVPVGRVVTDVNEANLNGLPMAPFSVVKNLRVSRRVLNPKTKRFEMRHEVEPTSTVSPMKTDGLTFSYLYIKQNSLWWLAASVVFSLLLKVVLLVLSEHIGVYLSWSLFTVSVIYSVVYGFGWFYPGRARLVRYEFLGRIADNQVDVRPICFTHAPQEGQPQVVRMRRFEKDVLLGWRDVFRMCDRSMIDDRRALLEFGWDFAAMIGVRTAVRPLLRPVVEWMPMSWGSMTFLESSDPVEVEVSLTLAAAAVPKLDWQKHDRTVIYDTIMRLAPVVNVDLRSPVKQFMLQRTIDYVVDRFAYDVAVSGHKRNHHFSGAQALPLP